MYVCMFCRTNFHVEFETKLQIYNLLNIFNEIMCICAVICKLQKEPGPLTCKIVIHEPCLGRPRFIMPALGPYKNQ